MTRAQAQWLGHTHVVHTQYARACPCPRRSGPVGIIPPTTPVHMVCVWLAAARTARTLQRWPLQLLLSKELMPPSQIVRFKRASAMHSAALPPSAEALPQPWGVYLPHPPPPHFASASTPVQGGGVGVGVGMACTAMREASMHACMSMHVLRFNIATQQEGRPHHSL